MTTPTAQVFYEYLDKIRLAAGNPSYREIALRIRKAGGQASPSTIHNIFYMREKYPNRWQHVGEIVAALGGDRTQAHQLWQLGWLAESKADLERTLSEEPDDSTAAALREAWLLEEAARALSRLGTGTQHAMAYRLLNAEAARIRKTEESRATRLTQVNV